MKIAITVWGNRISPLFDSAQTIMFADISDGSVHEGAREFVADSSGPDLAHVLVEKEIDTLICGAISAHPARIIESAGIRLIAFVTGNACKVLKAYAAGASTSAFLMPGCCRFGKGPGGTTGRRVAHEKADGSTSLGNNKKRCNHAEKQKRFQR